MTDFMHLNMQIAKNNLAYASLKDTFTLLGSSKCEVLSVLDLKDASIPLDSLRIPRNIVEFFPILAAHHTCIREMPMGLNISPAV